MSAELVSNACAELSEAEKARGEAAKPQNEAPEPESEASAEENFMARRQRGIS